MFFPYLFLVSSILLAKTSSGQVELGSMESWGFNGVQSDEVTLLSEKKMRIENLRYTGEGPAAWFMVGKDDDNFDREFTDLDGVIIPDENGGCDRLGRYRGDDVELTLPANMKFTDYDYLSIYCIRFSHNFGYIPIKKGITFAPPANATEPVAAAPVAPAAPAAAVAAAPQPQDDGGDDLPAECDQEPERRNRPGEEDDLDEEDDE